MGIEQNKKEIGTTLSGFEKSTKQTPQFNYSHVLVYNLLKGGELLLKPLPDDYTLAIAKDNRVKVLEGIMSGLIDQNDIDTFLGNVVWHIRAHQPEKYQQDLYEAIDTLYTDQNLHAEQLNVEYIIMSITQGRPMFLNKSEDFDPLNEKFTDQRINATDLGILVDRVTTLPEYLAITTPLRERVVEETPEELQEFEAGVSWLGYHVLGPVYKFYEASEELKKAAKAKLVRDQEREKVRRENTETHPTAKPTVDNKPLPLITVSPLRSRIADEEVEEISSEDNIHEQQENSSQHTSHKTNPKPILIGQKEETTSLPKQLHLLNRSVQRKTIIASKSGSGKDASRAEIVRDGVPTRSEGRNQKKETIADVVVGMVSTPLEREVLSLESCFYFYDNCGRLIVEWPSTTRDGSTIVAALRLGYGAELMKEFNLSREEVDTLRLGIARLGPELLPWLLDMIDFQKEEKEKIQESIVKGSFFRFFPLRRYKEELTIKASYESQVQSANGFLDKVADIIGSNFPSKDVITLTKYIGLLTILADYPYYSLSSEQKSALTAKRKFVDVNAVPFPTVDDKAEAFLTEDAKIARTSLHTANTGLWITHRLLDSFQSTVTVDPDYIAWIEQKKESISREVDTALEAYRRNRPLWFPGEKEELIQRIVQRQKQQRHHTSPLRISGSL